ncbi:MAG: type IV secretory system conjugative DNA transfer family protein [Nisaea sp.]|uniref:type IV secretory system conjugative DNA transfer family protein n=1 Tax=Nisaea sp. TaxID=2024842 RepID=UPI001B232819|nr:type IV secretory system conjugative DNA transfer family protein [Nisaea sp.]MBO6559442.1 type IV secretory system conjugative DNA transfer family protein [Nisaea sp.]
MAAPFSRSATAFGSARFAEPKEIAEAGLFNRTRDSLFVGFYGNRGLVYSGMAGLVTCAGPRSGKLTTTLAYNICSGGYSGTSLILDVKGECAAISQWQVPARKFCIFWNPRRFHGLPYHRINPVGHLNRDNPDLVSDVLVFCENMIPPSGSANGRYFEGRAHEFLAAIVLTIVKCDSVLTLPALYRAINLLVMGGEAWLDFAFEMTEAGFDLAERIEEEAANSRADSTGGFKGILGEITRAFTALADPVLMEAVSPPFDFCLSQLCSSDQTYNLYLMPPTEAVEPWAAVLKAFFVGARTYKARAPSAPRQTWFLDECGQLGGFPLVAKLFTRDAGLGIRPWAFFQSTKQMNNLAPDGESLLLASAGLQSWYGIRDERTARTVSTMLGNETLAYVDPRNREMARHGALKAAKALFSGGNPLNAALDMAHQKRMAEAPILKSAPLCSVDELLGMPADKQLIFADGLSHPIWADRRPYYEQPFMAGRYHPNPYHPPIDRVLTMTPRGPQWRPVIVEKVDPRFSHYPQYADGTWSRIG